MSLLSSNHRRSGSLNKHHAYCCNSHHQQTTAQCQQQEDESSMYEEDYQVLAIEQSVNYMDAIYDATFGTWIRDHRNLAQALPHLLRIAQNYPWTALVPVLNYLTVDWPLDAILHLVQSLVHLHPNHYGGLIGRFLAPVPVEVQVHVLRGLKCQEYFSVDAWKQFLQEGWDFSAAAILLGALFECSHAKQLLKSIYSA